MKEYKVKVNGNEYNVSIEEVGGTVSSVVAAPKAAANQAVKAPAATASVSTPSAGGAGSNVVAPLPGVILDITVKEGDSVKKGDKVCVLEAMKMENAVEATADGVVKSIKVKKSDSVQEGDVLVVIG